MIESVVKKLRREGEILPLLLYRKARLDNRSLNFIEIDLQRIVFHVHPFILMRGLDGQHAIERRQFGGDRVFAAAAFHTDDC